MTDKQDVQIKKYKRNMFVLTVFRETQYYANNMDYIL